MKIVLLLLSIIAYNLSYCQVTGLVLNAIDGKPLPAASIFINNSSKGTLSNDSGKFVLQNNEEKNFELIITYTGFTAKSVKITPENIRSFFTIKLYPRKEVMQEVTVMAPEKDGWETWGRLFTENFIGTSDFAEKCKIENPEVLRFFYDKKNKILTAFSNGNLLIKNNALGYMVRYQLEEFTYDQQKKFITYFGYTGFEDLNARTGHKEKKWDRNRAEAYKGSILHFMRSVYAGTTATEGFDVREEIKVDTLSDIYNQIYRDGNLPATVKIDSNYYVPYEGHVNYRMIYVTYTKKKPEYINLIGIKNLPVEKLWLADTNKNEKGFYFLNYLKVIYKNAKEKDDYLLQNGRRINTKTFQNSEITLRKEEALSVMQNGLYFDPLNVISSGYWGWCKMAEMLPADYQLPDDEK